MDKHETSILCWASTLILGVTALLLPSGQSGAAEKAPAKVTYDEHVRPILRQKCLACHNQDKRSGDLDMGNYTNLMQGGGSGEVIEPGDASSSYLYMLVTHEDEPAMPPDSPKLPDDVLETIRTWIDGGALESAGSKARAAAKPKFDLTLSTAPGERPAVVPMPARLSLEPTMDTARANAATALATSPFAPLVAVAGQTQVLLYHSRRAELLGVLPFPEGVPHVLRFSRNGSLLLAGGGHEGGSGRVVVWDVKTGTRLFDIGDELDVVLAADISADQTRTALGGPTRVVRVYSNPDGALLWQLQKHTDWITVLAFSPDNVLLATADRNGGLLLWEAVTGREYATLKGHGGAITGLAWRADSNVLASASEDGTIRLWEMEQGRQIRSINAHAGGAASVELARDGRILSCGRDRTAKLWDQNGKLVRAFEPFADLALQVTFCDETNRAIAGDWTGVVRMFEAADGVRVAEWKANPPTLEQRLRAAADALAAKQADAAPQTEAALSAQADVARLQAETAAANATVQEAAARSKSAAAAVTAATESGARATAAHQAATQAVAGLEPAISIVSDAAAKVRTAAETVTDVPELADAAATVGAVSERLVARLDGQRKTVGETTNALAQAQQQLDEVKKETADADATLNAARERAVTLGLELKAAQQKAAAANAAAEAAAKAVAEARRHVDRWQDEIAFTKKLQQLGAQHAAALEQLAARQAEHEQRAATAQDVEKQAAAARQAAADAGQAVAAAQREADRIAHEIATTRGLVQPATPADK